MNIVRRWWPIAAILVASLTLQTAFFNSRYDVSGHAAEHLDSASAPFAGAAFLLILLFATRAARRQPLVLLAEAAWFGATVLVCIGNVRVVDALIIAGQGHTPTDGLVEQGNVESAHDLANLAPYLGVLAAVVLVAAFFLYRHISRGVAIGAAIVSVLFPPWIIPGAGIIVVTIARCITYQREATARAATTA